MTQTISAEPIVMLTPAAQEQVKFLMRKKGGDLCLRLGVKGGGCSGFSYTMQLVEAADPGDILYEAGDIRVAVHPKAAQYLAGVTLDYTVKNLLEGGWKWTNPGAERTCGCGSSFTPG